MAFDFLSNLVLFILPSAHRPLPTAHCLLPTAYCLLLSAFPSSLPSAVVTLAPFDLVVAKAILAAPPFSSLRQSERRAACVRALPAQALLCARRSLHAHPFGNAAGFAIAGKAHETPPVA